MLNSQELNGGNAQLHPKTASADSSFLLHTEELLCGEMSTHRILHMKSISKWKIPPTYSVPS